MGMWDTIVAALRKYLCFCQNDEDPFICYIPDKIIKRTNVTLDNNTVDYVSDKSVSFTKSSDRQKKYYQTSYRSISF
jgi:hypothetical protein